MSSAVLRNAPACALCAVVLAMVACGSGGGDQRAADPQRSEEFATYRQEAGEVLGDLGAMPAGVEGGEEAERQGTWGVLIAQFPATSAGRAQAQAALPRVRTQGGLPTAFLEERGDSIAVVVGRHETIEQARRELAHVRNIEIQAQGQPARPYRGAVLAPPHAPERRGAMPEYDLRNAKARFGSRAIYTLQIGVYGRIDRTRPDPDELLEYRQTAERAVAQLRADGEEAFYYHGPTSSMVTIGIFGEDDHDPKTGVRGESARLRAARERHPNNLLNGKGIMETRRDADGRAVETLQRSSLVAIPD